MKPFLENKFFSSSNYLETISLFARNLLLKLSSCDLCGGSCQKYPLLCHDCEESLAKFYYRKVEGDLLNWPNIYQSLPNIYFDHLIALAPHQQPFQSWLSQLKYQGRFELATLLGELLAVQYQYLSTGFELQQPDLITCVPIHLKRWQERGFNQSHLLTQQVIKHLKKAISLPYDPNLIKRCTNTAKQVGQTGKERRKSLQGAFSLNTTISLPKHVMLVDDVVTTGATASAISYLLKQHGVEKVTLMTVTIALNKQSNAHTL